MLDPEFSYAVGDIVKITYTGGIEESYPAQIETIKIEIIEKSK